jgi:lactate racemase
LSTKIFLPHNAWFQPKEVAYNLPDNWDVKVYNIAGAYSPVLSAPEIGKAILSPIGMPPLREFARGRKEVVILFDDMTRCTPVSDTLPFILDELAKAGIKDNQVRFIAAVANHHALTYIDLVKKLGAEVVGRFAVYNHCPFLNCKEIGTTRYGTKVEINAEVMACDLKIAIGQIVPHPIYGLSGGGKMIMPGVSSYQSVLAHHGRTHAPWQQQRIDRGLPATDVLEHNPFRDDALEIAKMAGLDMIVNSLVDRLGRTVAVFAGALEPAHTAAVAAAEKHFAAENTADNDIVIANIFVKATEFNVPLSSSARALKPGGGTDVLVDNSPGGQVVHYLMDNFGSTIAGDLCTPIVLPPTVKDLIIFNKYPEGRLRGRFPNLDHVFFTTRWSEVISMLKKLHGSRAKVAVYPNADTQIFES